MTGRKATMFIRRRRILLILSWANHAANFNPRNIVEGWMWTAKFLRTGRLP